jgi:predicted phosphodiesterase
MEGNMTWKQEIKELVKNGNNTYEASRIVITKYKLTQPIETIRYHARKAKEGSLKTIPKKDLVKSSAEIESKIIKLLKEPISIKTIADKLEIDLHKAYEIISGLNTKGHNIYNDGDYFSIRTTSDTLVKTHNTRFDGDKVIRFGVVSDTHLNSRYAQITLLHQAYDEMQKQGIECVYHCGDIDEGDQMRMGHQYECYNQGADDHVEEVVKNYPKRDGMKTYFITGNHDHSFIKRNGLDIGKMISDKRPDMKYLGQSQAYINIANNCIMELRHPCDGSAYAISYKTQKMVDSISGGKKPKILLVGHYHKAEYIFYRNIHVFQAGALEAQTSFLRGKGISVSLGYWIIELTVTADGQINSLNQTFNPFYEEIENDYKNWR